MEVSLLVSIIGAGSSMLVAIAGIIGSYIVQVRTTSRERMFAREEEERKRNQLIEDSQKQKKREFYQERLKLIEEVSEIRMFLMGLTLSEEFGDSIHSDPENIKSKSKRQEELAQKAWVYTKAIDSKELSDCFRDISIAFYNQENTNHVESEKWKKALDGYSKLVKIIEEMVCSL
jgi:hypothetical protein